MGRGGGGQSPYPVLAKVPFIHAPRFEPRVCHLLVESSWASHFSSFLLEQSQDKCLMNEDISGSSQGVTADVGDREGYRGSESYFSFGHQFRTALKSTSCHVMLGHLPVILSSEHWSPFPHV